MVDRCVVCGAIVPEGTQVCPNCTHMHEDGGLEMNNNNSGRGAVSIGFTGLLSIAFIILKLCNVINWPWVWVLAPIWIPFVILLIIFVILLIIGAIQDKKDSKPSRR